MTKPEPKIVELAEKKLVGHNIEMSLINNKNQELFSGFMPRKKQLTHTVSDDVYEVLIYEANHFKSFNPANIFTKWAAVEVSSLDNIPDDMHSLSIENGLYAVFHYKGLSKDFGTLMQFILMNWLPESEYVLDYRPHFNVLGEKSKRNHPDSEEDVYIPIKEKS